MFKEIVCFLTWTGYFNFKQPCVSLLLGVTEAKKEKGVHHTTYRGQKAHQFSSSHLTFFWEDKLYSSSSSSRNLSESVGRKEELGQNTLNAVSELFRSERGRKRAFLLLLLLYCYSSAK